MNRMRAGCRAGVRPRAARIAAALVPVVLAACATGEAETPAAEREARPVRVATVETRTMAGTVVAAGTLGPADEVPLAFKIGGVVGEVLADPGERVRAGQRLAALEPDQIDAALAKAAAAAGKAERDLERARRLYADSVVTRVQLQDAETVAEAARADLDAVRFERRYSAIVAPAAGTILRRLAEPGETVDPGAPVLVLGSDARGAVVRVGLADRDVVRVKAGDVATVRFDALPGRTLEGRVAEIGGAAVPGTGTWPVEVAVDGAAGLPAGLVARVEIATAAEAAVPVVPVAAVLEADGRQAVVFVVATDADRAERRSVTIGPLAGGVVVVEAGLAPGERVVTEGAAWLSDGDAVEVVR